MPKNYDQVYDDIPWIVDDSSEITLQCCDCGFVHVVNITSTKFGGERVLIINMKRDKSRTKKARRHVKFKRR